MFKKTLTQVAFAIAGTALSLGVMEPKPVQAASFSFTQGGFTGGGTLSGMFSGEDTNNDDLIDYSELTSWMLSWSGDSIIADFTHNSVSNILPDSFAYFIPENVLGFFISLDDPLNPDAPDNNFAFAFLPGFGGFTVVSTAELIDDLGDVEECITANTCSVSIDLIQVSVSVPEPGMEYGMAVLGLLSLGGILRKKL